MRKRPITPIPQAGTPDDEGWLNLDRMASRGISPFGCAEALYGVRKPIFRHLSNCEQSPHWETSTLASATAM